MQGTDIKNELINIIRDEILQHNPKWSKEQLTPIAHSLSPIGCSFYLRANNNTYFLKYIRDALYREHTEKISRLLMELSPGLVPALINQVGGGGLLYEYLSPAGASSYSLITIKPVLHALCTLHNQSKKVNAESIPQLASSSLLTISRDLLEQSEAEFQQSPSLFQQIPAVKKSTELFAYLQAKLEMEEDVLNNLSPQGIHQVLSHGDINTGNILTRNASVVFADLEHVGFRDFTDDLAQTILMLESISIETIHSVISHYLKTVQGVRGIGRRTLAQIVCSKTIIASTYQILCMLIYYLSLKRLGYSYSKEESLLATPPESPQKEPGCLVLSSQWKDDPELPLEIVQQFIRLQNLTTLAKSARGA